MPKPGERKAWRKRITLSNNSALVVPGLVPLDSKNMVDPASAGQIFSLSDALLDQLRTVEAFKPSQSWGLFRQPSLLVRDETTRLAQNLENAAGKKESHRLVIYGDRLAGKSMMLLQAMSFGFFNEWVVISIPEGMPRNQI